MARTVSINILGNPASAIAALDAVGIKAEETAKKTDKIGSTTSGAGSKLAEFGKIAGASLIGAGVASVKMASDFQASMTELVTGAGESESNLKLVSDGILKMAPQVGTTTKQLSSGMYMIESAGYHGAQGLSVLKAAAEGAKVGNADLGTVADALTTVLNDYHLPASKAADVTSKLVATVAAGKTHMQDLAGSLAKVAPAASAAGVGLDQVLGAMATMTSKGTPAADAATYLRQTILQLSNPTAKAQKEMEALGLSSIDISSHLGQRGLTGTFALLTEAIERHMGPAGTVLIDQLKKVSGNTSAFQQILANLPPTQQTYVAALANMVGGTKSMQAALELTGSSTGTFNANVKTIGGTTATATGHVKGFNLVQGDFKFKMDQAKASLEVVAIRIGTALIPILEHLMNVVSRVIGWLQKHSDVAKALAGVIITVLGAAMVMFAVEKVAKFIGGIQSAMTWLGNLSGKSKDTATKIGQDGQAMGNSAKGPGSWSDKFQGGLFIIAAGVAAFQATSALLKSNFLGIGGAINDATKAISDFFGGIGQVKPVTSLTPQAVTFLEQVASGAVSASNITPAAAAQDLHAAGVPGYLYGGYVPSTGLALLHAGETVIPAGRPAGGGAAGVGSGDLVLQVNGRELARVAGPDFRTWLLQGAKKNSTRVGLA